jgi:glutamyl-tRNA reductase
MNLIVPIWTLSFDPANTTPESRSVIADGLAAAEPHTHGWLVLRTCRRVVILGAGPGPAPGAIIAAVGPEAAGKAHGRDGSSAIEHILRLAAGLESAVIGEDQILSQIRALRRSADAAVIVDARLVRLLDTAIFVGRRARADRPRDERSLAERGLAWLQERSGPLAGARMLVAGVGPIGREIARLAATAGAHITVASRDPAAHAQAHGPGEPGTPISLAEAVSLVPSVDLLAVALAGQWPDLVALESPLPITVDLSAPPAVPAAVRARSGSRLATLEELAGSGVAPSETTAAYVVHAEELARAAATALCTELGGTDHVSVLRAIRADAEARRATDLVRLYRRLPELDDRQRALIEQASRRLVAGLLHEPTRRLRDDPGDARVALARDLFGVGRR